MIALLLAWSAGRGLLKELVRVPPNRYFEMHDERLRSEADEGRALRKALELYAHMPGWTRGPTELRRLGFLSLQQAQGDKREGRADASTLADDSESALKVSARSEPLHPLTWAYLADLELGIRDNPTQAFRYLKTSYEVAPIAADIRLYRLRLALRCRTLWDLDFFRMMREDIQALFSEAGSNMNRKPFVQAIRPYPPLVAFVETLLKDDASALETYRKALKAK
ncbi:hypothetical protein [Thiocystis violacea]|uniref:hypothetical protein n=1 Tax=Thiocystis violacea TaxID=13725 RepID=UPI0019032647|nr:hypothetical protein [Thiocystis violacea]MBK1719638.1 hypothetical protein [Thiocystis violacea]